MEVDGGAPSAGTPFAVCTDLPTAAGLHGTSVLGSVRQNQTDASCPPPAPRLIAGLLRCL